MPLRKGLSDEELIELIVEQFEDDGRLRLDVLEIDSHRGRPVIRGRVRNDSEIQVIDEILNDVLDIHDYENTVWVDDSLAFETPDEESDEDPPLEEEEEEEEELEEDDSPFGSDDDEK